MQAATACTGCKKLARLVPICMAGGVIEAMLAWFLFFSIGVAFLYNFVMHVFFGEMAACFIGWADSPFQAEVGFASLGVAADGFLAVCGNGSLRLAAILGPALFRREAAGLSRWRQCR